MVISHSPNRLQDATVILPYQQQGRQVTLWFYFVFYTFWQLANFNIQVKVAPSLLPHLLILHAWIFHNSWLLQYFVLLCKWGRQLNRGENQLMMFWGIHSWHYCTWYVMPHLLLFYWYGLKQLHYGIASPAKMLRIRFSAGWFLLHFSVLFDMHFY